MTVFDALFPSLPIAPGSTATSAQAAEGIECPDCGKFQILPLPDGRHDRVCCRCHSSFGSGYVAIGTLLALSLASALLFIAVNCSLLMGVFIEGRHNAIGLAAAAANLFEQNHFFLGAFVFGLTLVMPFLHLSLQTGVLFCLWRGYRPQRLARIFLWAERVRPWAMLDVFLLGLFITYSKLGEMAQVQLLPGLGALAVLVASFVAFGACVDRQEIWDHIAPPPAYQPGDGDKKWIGCLSCNLLHDAADANTDCLRCGSRLHPRKPASLRRTWALVIAASILYVPANAYPMMTLVSFGQEHPATIMRGVRELWSGIDWPYAILVFVASIVIPLLKLAGLTACLLICQLRRRRGWLIPCTRLYRFFDRIGRWSMLDIYVTSTLGALVDFGNLATVIPGPGLICFAAVVVLTMLAVNGFDPRLMWDAAGKKHE